MPGRADSWRARSPRGACRGRAAPLGRGHAGELGEFVDDAAQVVGLADDDVGVLLERLALVADEGAELAPQPLGRELDRGERVLDLVGDAAGDVAPGGHALGDDELGHVVEGDDDALERAVLALAGADPHQEVEVATAPAEADLALADPGAAGLELAQERRQFGRGGLERLAEDRVALDGEKPGGRRVDHLDAALAVEADHARGDARQDRVEEAPAPLRLRVRRDQRVALGLHLAGHVVEGVAEERDLVLAVLDVDPDVEVALPHPLGGGGEPAHRLGQPLGEPQAEPDRAEDHHQREAEIDQRELEDEPAAVAFELVVERDGLGGLVEERQDLAVDLPADVEEAVGEGAELVERAELVVRPVLDDDDLARAGAVDLLRARRDEVEEIGALAAGAQPGVAVDDVGLGQGALHLQLAEGEVFAQLPAREQRVALLLLVQEVAEERASACSVARCSSS
jgi:hypothetical protein